ncbi:MAG: tRNA (uridine(34)/cytosine(34)/5-carboxymethylaminomethyluridine(34)-2'-O)-methyltransferase TrmL [Thermanaeromonas sp.]|uniref:tRNA (uridine(34)/cytosine(34)/5- carboxymethylaminomethyluridine(34)-2'-O)- methyltransferase TrmL n=1 Tax=Thermanaeromonas sp. TaxID=2003697 RepID=UPI0024408A4C|nr:tRNA (uridine(34)/cytosine(34)/5-carboxymethylaminomethyluridine(34)-2'-O)-methyltransferase TrmL [Thermanaeromonas sp.]MCG0278097.1 tRNA (uridine(34)/cytosine(34)/5-carboxymethylaminomethyluridine(34)-2'-O)-methyltransferase TrmL [Thermanaeromonas sp.]
MPLNVVLVEPEIPQNTGNIARTCAATGSILHLVHPLGFSLDEKYLRRAGLDYWDKVNIVEHTSWFAFCQAYPNANCYYFSTKGRRRYTEVKYSDGDFLIFGPETRGLSAEILSQAPERVLRIPMRPGLRSLNLANSVALVLYEALRQLGFPGLV